MNKTVATLIGFSAILTWSFLALLSTAAGPVPPFQLAAMAFLIGGLVGASSWIVRPAAIKSLRQPWPVWAIGTAGLCIYHCAYFFAIQSAPPVEVSLIAYLWPLLIVVFAAFLPGEKLRVHHVAGVILGLAGAVVVITKGGRVGLANGVMTGHIVALFCAFVWSGYSVLSRRFGRVPTDVVAGYCLITAAVAFGLHLALEPTVWPATAAQWAAIAILGAVPLGAGFYAWDYGCKHGDIMILGALSYAAPLLSVIVLLQAGYGVFHWSVALACLLITVGAVVAARDLLFKAPRPVSSANAEVCDDALPDGDVGPAAPAVLSALNDPAFLLDRAGIVRFANAKAGVQFAATRPGDPLTLTFRSPEIRAALETPGSASVVEYREPGRSTRIFAVSFGPIRSPAYRDWLLVVVEDASDRFAITRMRADFVANASHELRTPLASLAGFIETLLGPARNDPAATERFLHVMQEQAGRMRRIIDDLLTLSRVEMGEHRTPTAIVDVASLLREVSDALGPIAAEQAVAISVTASQETVNVRGSRDELFQVFGNLIENAIRYGASGRRVDVAAASSADGSPVAVTVRDYGPGIAPEHLPRLTERFYRVDVGASRSMKGTGLGLAIVKHILTRHGARLEIASDPGKGAAFTVRFPPAVQKADRSS